MPVANSVLISGFVDQPEHIDRIIRIAEEYYPKVINNMTVGGVQQVLLHVKVMEVSRTKLRRLGFDWAKITGTSIVTSSPGGLHCQHHQHRLPRTAPRRGLRLSHQGAGGTFAFGVVNGSNAFFGVLGRLAAGQSAEDHGRADAGDGQRPGGLVQRGRRNPRARCRKAWAPSRSSAKKYGTQIDFVPIVLGNGKIRLEVAPRRQRTRRRQQRHHRTAPRCRASRSREADTGVEMMAGQTLAIAGLVQTRVEAENCGLPWISEVPYLGAAFRKVHENDQRGRTADPGHAGTGRGDGRQRSAAVRAGHADHQPQRLGTVHEGAPRSAQVLPGNGDGNGDCRHERRRPRRRRRRTG